MSKKTLFLFSLLVVIVLSVVSVLVIRAKSTDDVFKESTIYE